MTGHPARRGGLLALAAVLAFGCGETRTEREPTDLAIDLTHCLGDAKTGKLPDGTDTACRSRLDELVVGAGTNACLLIREAEGAGGQVHYVPFRWAESRLVPLDEVPEIPVEPGTVISAELYLHGDGFEADLCAEGGIAYGSPCTAQTLCVLKLTNKPIPVADDGSARIDFLADDVCTVEWLASAREGAEVCDSKDNDCNGRADETFEDLGRPCKDGVGACERTGTITCAESGTACNVVAGEPADAEACNKLDDDCDGVVDEGLAGCIDCRRGEVRDCGAGVGVCVAGQQQCIVADGQEEGELGPCLDENGAQVPLPNERDELCNGLDDNCNRTVDEGFRLGEPCEVGVGLCARDGLVACRADGTAGCNVEPGLPSAEICDGEDNDCDEMVDEEFPTVGEACTVGVGACQQMGTFICDPDDPSMVACDRDALAPSDERCDGIDNDCNGQTDEAFPELGAECTVGVGACEQTGHNICDPADTARVKCDRDPLPAMPETCDLNDNDCDGQSDETFDLATDPLNCGQCGNVCNLPHARPHCEAEECVLEDEDCVGGFENQDGILENGCECNPDEPDAPDPGPTFTDTNCDGVDGDVDLAVFVSAQNGNDGGGTGRVDRPYRSLARGVEVAALVGASVYLDRGTYDVGGVTQVVPSGVSIYGGYLYDPDGDSWRRDTRTENPSIITGAAVPIRYEDLEAETILDNLEVRATDADEAESSVAIFAVNVGGHLLLRNVLAQAGAGGDGSPGEDGREGASTAAEGLRGVSGDDMACSGCGGVGGVNNGCPMGTAGGRGGDGGRSRGRNDQAASAGDDGAGMSGGDGGALGALGMSGQVGEHGGDGPHGANATGALADGRIDQATLHWVPRFGGTAGNGTHGAGGGGGGGGGSIDGRNGVGGGGGGGGSGGCAGTGGRAASGGGGSFALQLVGGTVRLQQSELRSGVGGGGGEGGSGGAGVSGTEGQEGGGRGGCNGCGVGGAGGNGGKGGCGGNSGGGAGGPSFALLRVSPDQRPANLAMSDVTFEDYDGRPEADAAAAAARSLRAGGAGDGGDGGSAGPMCGAAAQPGRDGFGGPVGCCRHGSPGPECGDLSDCSLE